jgi:DNA-binding NtrC family response regulator
LLQRGREVRRPAGDVIGDEKRIRVERHGGCRRGTQSGNQVETEPMEKARILVVDDNESFRESVVEMLRRQGYEVVPAVNGPVALGNYHEGAFDLVVSDLKMPGMSGIELLERVRQIDADVPFLMMTAYGVVETAVEAMKKGAHDFILKTENVAHELEVRVERTLQYRRLVSENRDLRSALQNRWRLIGAAGSMEEIKQLVNKVAQSRSTVVISGESGTGKELIARSVHYLSPRQNGPFVKINCAAVPEGLIESELFGHEKGAFTGAIRSKSGKFELASGGTLLLDEIGEMAAAVQAKLLRVLQEREISKVGADDTVSVDVRIVATTNRNLDEEVRLGRFREDLYYRLNVFHIHLPPLRERKADIGLLAEHFVQKYNEENGYSVEGLEPEAFKVLTNYDWPGNIRELENAIERAVVLTRTGVVKAGLFDLRSVKDVGAGSGFAFAPGITIESAEKELILRTLEHCKQNRTHAAQMLGISIRTLRNKLHEYGVSKE